jgi:hypothetical protein
MNRISIQIEPVLKVQSKHTKKKPITNMQQKNNLEPKLKLMDQLWVSIISTPS